LEVLPGFDSLDYFFPTSSFFHANSDVFVFNLPDSVRFYRAGPFYVCMISSEKPTDDSGSLHDLSIDNRSALLVVDMQHDFLPGGALPVSDGDALLEPIAAYIQHFVKNEGRVLFSQDWHPKGHHSFASTHPGKNPGDPIDTPGLGPILWPDHCIQNTPGAKIHPDLPVHLGMAIIRKGYHLTIDSYSAFLENDHITKTGLAGLLRDLDVEKLFVCGLALDYCCYYSAIDAKEFGFDVYFLKSLTRGIDLPPGNIAQALETMENRGIHLVE